MDEIPQGMVEAERELFSVRPVFGFSVFVFALALGTGSLVREKERLAEKLPLSRMMDASVRPDDEEAFLGRQSELLSRESDRATPEVPSPRFSLTPGRDLRLVLNGTVPTAELKQRLADTARSAAPELAKVDDRLVVDSTVDSPPWLTGVPELLGSLISTVQDPELRIDRTVAWIGGATDDKAGLTALREQYHSLFSTRVKISDRLELDETKPAPSPLLPLVFYMGAWEGKYWFEGSLPSLGQREAILAAAVEVTGENKVEDRLRVSTRTVDEPWLYTLPLVVSLLLKEGTGIMELVIVDGILSVSGEISGEDSRAKLLDILEPVRAGGYEIRDQLKIRNLNS